MYIYIYIYSITVWEVKLWGSVVVQLKQYECKLSVTFYAGRDRSNARSSESPLPPSAAQSQPQQQLKQMEAADVPKKLFNPICSVDGMQLSIHCHINAVKTLVCVPGQVPKDSKCYLVSSPDPTSHAHEEGVW